MPPSSDYPSPLDKVSYTGMELQIMTLTNIIHAPDPNLQNQITVSCNVL